METNDNKKELILKCEDNCSCVSVDKWENEPIYYLTFYKSYPNKNLFGRIKDAFWHILGRDIVGTEVLLDEDDFEKIRNFGK